MSVQWVFFDAFGTLIHLDRIFERLQANLQALGHPLPLADVEYATRKEFAYYIAHSATAGDAASLQALRRECGAVLLAGLRERGRDLPLSPEQMAEAIVGSLEFRLFPDARPALELLAGRGIHLGMISNWDCSLPEIVSRIGLDDLLEVVAVSALCRCEKPNPALFREALRRAGVPASAALHVGDSYEKDVQGARAAGMQAVLLDRKASQPPADVVVIRELGELAQVL